MAHADEVVILDAEFLSDPYILYRELRTDGSARAVQIPGGERFWLVTRYADVRATLTDPAIGKDSDEIMRIARARGMGESLSEYLRTHMLNSDPPEHTRLRKLVSKVFTGRAVEGMRARIVEIADALIAGIGDRAEIDLLNDFAFPMPLTVICEILGIPGDEREDFRRWSDSIVSSKGDLDDMRDAADKMADYLTALVTAKRRRPGSDLLSTLVHARDGGDVLTDRELVSTAFLLLFAGHETTVNLIASGMMALLRNPDQLAALRADRTLLPGAIEEFLRYESPINITTTRYTKHATRIGEVEIPADEFVMVALGSANRDAERFEEPDTVDITRRAAGHVAFGHGVHYCVGAALARLEGEIAFDRLLSAFAEFELAVPADELEWRPSAHVRGLSKLPVRVRRA